MISTRHNNKHFFLGDNASSIIELLKWIGIVAMTLDHIGILILGDNDILRMIGRLAFPIFGFVLVYNFTYHTKNKVKYIKRIALFSFIFEPIHFIVFKNHYAGLNIFFIYTLALAFLYLYELVQEDKEEDKRKRLFLVVFLAISIYVSQYTEYSISGILLTISFYFLFKDKRYIVITLLFLVLLNAPALRYLLSTFDYTLHLFILSVKLDLKYILSTLLMIPTIFIISKINVTIPRSRYFFYLYYPIHLLALGAINY